MGFCVWKAAEILWIKHGNIQSAQIFNFQFFYNWWWFQFTSFFILSTLKTLAKVPQDLHRSLCSLSQLPLPRWWSGSQLKTDSSQDERLAYNYTFFSMFKTLLTPQSPVVSVGLGSSTHMQMIACKAFPTLCVIIY